MVRSTRIASRVMSALVALAVGTGCGPLETEGLTDSATGQPLRGVALAQVERERFDPLPLNDQLAPFCAITLGVPSFSLGHGAASLSVSVTPSQPTCHWDVAGVMPWLQVSPREGVGSGTLSVVLGANLGPARATTLRIGQHTLPISQAGDPLSAWGAIALPPYTSSRTLAMDISTVVDRERSSLCVLTGEDVDASACRIWRPNSDRLMVTLPEGDGHKQVSVWARDGEGVIAGSRMVANTMLDTVPPTDGTLLTVATPSGVRVQLRGFHDAANIVMMYRLSRGTSPVEPHCQHPDELVDATQLIELPWGTGHWRICAVDGAGNVSAGVELKGPL